MSSLFLRLKSAFTSSAAGTLNVNVQEVASYQHSIYKRENFTVSYDWIENFFGGDYSLAEEAMNMFFEDSVPDLMSLQKILRNEGLLSLHKHLHKIKPSFRIIGLGSFSDALSELEKECLSATDPKPIENKLQHLIAGFNQLYPKVKQQYSDIHKLANA